MGALYEDILLNFEQKQRVLDYVRHVNFHAPGATSSDFSVSHHARYLGYLFQAEDLEAFGVGLRCTKPGMEDFRTFIRMSRGQIMGENDAPALPVNEPVTGAASMTMQRMWSSPSQPQSHGVSTYSSETGLAGADEDINLIETQLRDILDFHDGRPVALNQEILDLKVNWGTLLSGRYARLKLLRDRLSAPQKERLREIEEDILHHKPILETLDLPTLETLKTKPVIDG